MENTSNQIEPLFEKIEEYGKTTFELYKLKAISKTTEVVSTFVYRGAVALVLSMCLVLVSIGLALWLGEVLGKPYLGFFGVATLYCLLGGVLYFSRHCLKRKIGNSFISNIFRH